jgi:hypothetical protein
MLFNGLYRSYKRMFRLFLIVKYCWIGRSKTFKQSGKNHRSSLVYR